MSIKRHSENYNGHTIVINGAENKWGYVVTIRDYSIKSQVTSSNFTSPRAFLTKEEAMMGARKFINYKNK